MDKQRLEWLTGEVKSWLQAGLIDSQSASSILSRYQLDNQAEESTSWSSVILASLGALLIGGGVILLFAHNWDDLGKSARTVLSFLPLLMAQGLAFYAYKYRTDSRGWAESGAILVFLGIASSIALIGQTYHIYGNLERFFVTWLALGIPLLYLMRSKTVFILCCLLIIWLCGLGHALHWLWYLALIPAWIAMYRQPHQWGFLWATWFLAMGFYAALMMSLDFYSSPIIKYGMLIALLLACGYYLLGKYLLGFKAQGFWHNPFSNLGAIIIAACSLWLTWSEVWQISGWGFRYWGARHEYVWQLNDYLLLIVLATVFLAVVFGTWRNVKQLTHSSKLLLASSLFALAPILSNAFDFHIGLFIVPMNIYILVTSIALIFEGVNSQRLKVLNAGLLWLSLLIMFRFFDSDIGFVFKGLAFILVGSLFIGANIWFKKRQKSNTLKAQGDQHEA